MPRLKTIKPRLATLSTQRVKAVEVRRIGATPRTRGRAWMETRARWLRKHPLCIHCQAQGLVTAAEEVDHVIPLWMGGRDDETNFQSLCKACHAAKTAEEAKGRGG
jgi:5-methylcytosine-specific restriction protein A